MLFFFAFTLFVSATLLFLVQPMIGKMILPKLGGSPAVWNTCMVFFQGILLFGYAYTHFLSSLKNRKQQLVAQGLLILLPFLVLPFSIGTDQLPTDRNPVFALLWMLVTIVGLPFFVVATSAPLLQKWFGGTAHPAAKDPYFLYGASNLGSMLALLLYPAVVERMFGVTGQTYVWTTGYAIFAAFMGCCIVWIWRTPELTLGMADVPVGPPIPEEAVQTAFREAPPQPRVSSSAIRSSPRARRRLSFQDLLQDDSEETKATSSADRPLSVLRCLRWIGLAAIPSSLMLGTTQYLTTDIAAIAFFWVIPLALYLFTFILVFARWPVVWTNIPHTIVLYVQPMVLLTLLLLMKSSIDLSVWQLFVAHIGAFLLTTLMCHGELAKDRPGVRHLTGFYLCMSIGGVCGGMFNALFAPVFLRTGLYEYPAAMVLAIMLRPPLFEDVLDFLKSTNIGLTVALDVALGTLILLGAYFLKLIPFVTDTASSEHLNSLRLAALALAMALFVLRTTLSREQWTKFALDLCLGIAIGAGAYYLNVLGESFTSSRWDSYIAQMFLKGAPFCLLILLLPRPVAMSLALAALLIGIEVHERQQYRNVVFEDRSFFSFVRIRKDTGAEGYVCHTLIHGGINHGMQYVDKAVRRAPISYFEPDSGIGQVFANSSWPDARLPAAVIGMGMDPWSGIINTQSEPSYAVIGLGVGTLASHAKPMQRVDFYEIDPLVERLSLPPAGEEAYFFYLQDAIDRGADLNVILGDGRIRMAAAPKTEKHYHVITIDAFNSDAVPVHLLTDEALKLYLSKLADGGIIVFNVTNRYLNLRPALANIAANNQLDCISYSDGNDDRRDKCATDYVIMRRQGFDKNANYSGSPPLAELFDLHEPRKVGGEWEIIRGEWQRVPGDNTRLWTDDYTNLLHYLSWRPEE